MLEKLLHSKAATKVLGFVLYHDGFHLREIARQCEISPSEAKRELDILVDLGLLIRKKCGNQIIIHTNNQCPFLPDIKNLYQKTEGLFSILRETLGNFNIKYAFVFGSTAKGTDKSISDIDLMVIGEESDAVLSNSIFTIQRKLNREINFIYWSNQDFREKLRTKNSFLVNITKQKITWILGDENEFSRIVKEGSGKKN